MKIFCAVVLLFCSMGFSQNLEENIYVAAEMFIRNKSESALKILNQAEAKFKAEAKTKDEQLALIFLQCHKAYYLNENGYAKDALFTYEDALQRFANNNLSAFSNFDITENCLKPLSALYTQTGDYTNAINTINQYLFFAKNSHNIPHQISGAINLSILYQTVGNTQMALQTVNGALSIKPLSTLQKNKLLNIKIGALIAVSKYKEASECNSLLINSEFSQNKNAYAIALKQKQYATALQYFNKAKAGANGKELTKRETAKFYVEEAQLHLLLNNKNEALAALQKALSILIPSFNNGALPQKDALYAENTFIDIFDLYASLQTNMEVALQSFDLSFYVSQLLRANWTSQENKIQQQAADRLRSEVCIDLIFNDFATSKNKKNIERAFQYAENNKVLVLKNSFEKQRRLKQNPNDSLLISENNLLKEQERLTGLLINEQLEKSNPIRINVYSKLLNDVSVQLKELQTLIEKKYPPLVYSYSVKTLQKKLKQDNAVLVEYFFGKHSLYQFTISDNDFGINQIPVTETLNGDIKNFIHLFDTPSAINNNVSAYTALAHELYKALNLKQVFRTKNTVVIPDGLLNFIPFEALLSDSTNTVTFSKMPFVVKTQTITYNTSAEFYATSSTQTYNNKLLGFFPVFENTGQALNYSINEAEAIKHNVNAELRLREQATKPYFVEHAKQYGILHLSTHATGGNFTTPAQIKFYDTPLFLNDLYHLKINSKLVVLSACETGIGKLYKGEGAISLARGFQYAGANNVLFSLWQINDQSTSQVMESFYGAYSKSNSAFVANRESKLDYLENPSISNAKKSPYYWSAFVFYGAVEPVKSSDRLIYIFVCVFLLDFMLFLKMYFYVKRNNTAPISA